MAHMRIDKYLANAGIGTRSEIKKYIKSGYVKVNMTQISKPDMHINSDTDVVTFQDEPIIIKDYEYYLLNKPAGYVSATKDNTAPTVISLIKSKRSDLFPVGRLDKDTEGLLLITNDGALSHRLLSPKHHVDKTYYATIKGKVTSEDIDLFSRGLHIGDEDLVDCLPATLTIVDKYNDAEDISYIHVTIQEGKFHQVKRMFHAIGKEVLYLQRISFASIQLPDDLPLGQYRELSPNEITSLSTLQS